MFKFLLSHLFGEPPQINEVSDDGLEFELIHNPLSKTSKEIARNSYLLTKEQRSFVAEQRNATRAIMVATVVMAIATIVMALATVAQVVIALCKD